MTRLVLIVVLVCASFSLFVWEPTGAQQPEGGRQMPPLRNIPAITAQDLFPGGCVDCHVHRPDMNLDARFATMMEQWSDKVEPGLLAKAQASAPPGLTLKGKHPPVAASLKDIPAACIKCHSKASKVAPPFAKMIHLFHLTGGDQNHFLTLFQGECTHCHKLNQSTGEWSLPSGPDK